MNAEKPSLTQASRIWWKIGFLSFGGPAAQIALMHRETVEQQKWLSEKEFLNALNFCMLLPGPEAMQLATYSGWRLHGTIGGLIAGIAFILPGAAVILALSIVYALYGNLPIIGTFFLGIKAAVLVIVIEALIKVSKRALNLKAHYVIAALAFIGIFFLKIPYPIIVLSAGLYGYFLTRELISSEEARSTRQASFKSTLKTIALWLAIWWLPIFVLWIFDNDGILISIATFFSKLAVVTFGGAYAVLAYMAQDVVEKFGWLTTTQMIDGLGLAETTPGPLILVTQFVGFLAAFSENNLIMAIIGAAVTLWVTFTPCFLWIFAGSPYIEFLSAQPKLKGALIAITAAVVGVILNLSVWFALHVMFTELKNAHIGPLQFLLPEITTINFDVIILSVLSGFLLLVRHWNVILVLLTASLSGYAISLF